MVTAGDFPEFFASVNGGREPFRWQTRVVNSILGRGRWPDHQNLAQREGRWPCRRGSRCSAGGLNPAVPFAKN